jgi:pilus assembly protein CpaB
MATAVRRRRQLNPRQRQGLLLVVVAAAGMVAVFALIASYVANVSKQVGPKVNVLVLSSPVAQYQPLSPNEMAERSVPAKWAPPNALHDPSEAAGLVAGAQLPRGTELEAGMLVAPPALRPGEREIAVMVDPETGVAGQVSPGSVVDIIATFQANNSIPGSKNSAKVIVAGAHVLSVGTPVATGGSTGGGGGGASPSSPGASGNAAVPVTFALTPQQVLQVSYAESFAQRVRLSLVAPGTSGAPVQLPPYTPSP